MGSKVKYNIQKNRSVISKWLISYFIIVAIPLIGFAAMYSWMRANVEQYELEMNEEIIRNTCEKIDEIIEKVNLSQISLSANTRVNQIATFNDIGNEEEFECYLLQKEIKGLLTSNENIHHMYIYFPLADICVLETTTMKADDFFLRYYGMNLNQAKEWKDLLMHTRYASQEKKMVIEGDAPRECVEFLLKYPLSGKKVSAVCVISVPTDKIFASLDREMKTSEFLVVNKNKDILFQDIESVWKIEDIENALKKENLDNKRTIISEQILNANWQLYSVTHKDKLLVKLNEIRKLSILFLACYSVICWFMIKNMTKRNYEPLKKLLHSISSFGNIVYEKNTNEYEWLQEVWKSTKNEFKTQQGVMLEKFWFSVLKGRISEQEWENKIQKLNIKFCGEEFVIVCFKFVESDEMNQFIVNNIATEIFEKKYYVFSLKTDDEVICILNYEGTSVENAVEDIREKITEIKEIVKKEFLFEFLSVISSEYSFYHGIHEAYEEVLEGIEHKLFYQKDAVIECSKLEISSNTEYYYPLEVEQNLIQSIVCGSYSDAQKIVDELFRRNFDQMLGNKILAKCFMSDFMATMLKASSKVIPNQITENDSELNLLMSELLDAGNIYEMKEDSITLLKIICKNIDSKSGSDISGKVISIIKEHYTDTQLSVAFIAEKLNLHPVYLGTLFKERTGEKMLDYIAAYRIEKAKEFMQRFPNETLECVGISVGYDNVRTFARVFKKYEGITPAQYKKQL